MNNLKKSNTITMLIICVIIVVITAYVLKFIEERCDVMYAKYKITQEISQYKNVKDSIGDISEDN